MRLHPAPILVVDDDGRTLRACDELFSAAGFPVRTARSGEEALDDLRRRPPAALVTEVALPGMDGLTLIRQARGFVPQLPALVLTAYPSAHSASRALRMGVDDYLIKHADTLGHLRRAVPRAMRRRSQAAETSRLLADLADLNEEFQRNLVELEETNRSLRARLPAPADSSDYAVLVVDDDEKVVALLEAVLRPQPGLVVTGVTSAHDARRALATRRFDLVMADKNLGDADGVELIGEIHERYSETDVLLMTGYATLESAMAALQHGALAYLQKPFDDLGSVVERVLELRTRRDEGRAERDYLRSLESRQTDFAARYRLIKNKLLTLQREAP